MTGNDLHALLERSIEGEPSQRSAFDDLRRAQVTTRRRRVRVVLGVVATAAASAVVATMAVISGSSPVVIDNTPAQAVDLPPVSTYAPAPWAPRASTYEPEEVTDEEALARCNAIDYFGTGPARIPAITIDPYYRPIYAGDTVDISTTTGEVTNPDGTTNPGWSDCVIPGSWTDPTPGGSDVIPASIQADDTEAVLLGCSAVAKIDFRDWVVAAAMVDGASGVAAALVSADQRFYATCVFGGVYREVWVSHHRTPAQAHTDYLGQLGLNGGSGCFDDTCATRPYSRANVLPAGVESSLIRLDDGTAIEVPVGVHGTYAASVLVPMAAPDPVIEAYDADGELVLSCPATQCG